LHSITITFVIEPTLLSIGRLIKARSHNLPWLILSNWGSEIWKHQFQFTEWSLAACNTGYCHRQHFVHSNSKNFRTR